jgi:hypothetical protein
VLGPVGERGCVGLEIGADLQGISQDHRATLGNQLLPGIGRAAYGTDERLMNRETLRSSHGDAIGAGAIAGDRPTKGGVDPPRLKDALGVIYLAAREGVRRHRATTRDAGAHFLRYFGA